MKKEAFRAKLDLAEVAIMGLKFQREDSLDKMFEEFAILPDQKEKVVEENKAIERFLKPEKKAKDKKNDQDD